MRRVVLAVVLGTVGAALAAPLSAQGRGGGGGRFAVELGTTAIAFPTPAIVDFDTGWVEHQGMVVLVDSRPPNRTWELRIRAESPDMGGYGKPVQDILWRADGSTAWVPLTATDNVVLQGQGDRDVTIHFRLRLGWDTDVPGTYSVDVTFSAARI